MPVNGWNEWSKHVLMELERLNTQQEEMGEQVTELRIQLSKLDVAFKIKSGIWGLIGGAIPVALALIIWLVRSQVAQ
jgi:hypothetical protein